MNYAGIQTSGCTITEVSPTTLNSQNTSSQNNYAPPTTITTITTLPCPTEGNNEPNLMEATFSSLDRLDSSDLIPQTFTLMEDSDHDVLSAELSASLHLAESSVRGESDEEIVVPENINMSDSFDRIADNTLNEFCEIYTKHK